MSSPSERHMRKGRMFCRRSAPACVHKHAQQRYAYRSSEHACCMRHSLRQYISISEVVMEVVSRGQSDALRAHAAHSSQNCPSSVYQTSDAQCKTVRERERVSQQWVSLIICT
eukprot:4474-Heterococcus_DN1.PRE.2